MKKEPKSLEKFFLKQKQRIYKKGQVIVYPENAPSGVFFVEKGFVKVYSLTESGIEKNHIFYKKGDIFPLILTFSTTQRQMFFEGITEVTLRLANKDEFLDFIIHDNGLLLEIIERILIIFDAYAQRIDVLGYKKTYSRLINHILFLAERFGSEKENKKNTIQIPLTHQDIAESIAMTRETVSRELERLEGKNLIKQTGRSFSIINHRGLRRELRNSS